MDNEQDFRPACPCIRTLFLEITNCLLYTHDSTNFGTVVEKFPKLMVPVGVCHSCLWINSSHKLVIRLYKMTLGNIFLLQLIVSYIQKPAVSRTFVAMTQTETPASIVKTNFKYPRYFNLFVLSSFIEHFNFIRLKSVTSCQE